MADPFVLLREAVAWLHVLVALGGLTVCVLNLRLSGWMWVLATGFAGQALAQLLFRMASLMIEHGVLPAAQVGLVFGIGSLLSLAAAVAEVGGIALVFAELKGKQS